MSVTTILAMVWLHFIADFVMQSHQMAINKGKSNKWLGYHVGVYMIPFLIVFGPLFAIINGALHFATDYITSRESGKQYAAGDMHKFFVVVGLDQAVHMTCLLITGAVLNSSIFGWF